MDKEIIEEIKELQEEREELKQEESKMFKFLRRTYILILVFIIFSLLLVNTHTGYHLMSLFSGQLVSSTLKDDYSFDMKQKGTVYFDQFLWENLEQYYMENQKYEFKLCLTGYKEENTTDYYVTGIYQPYIYEQDVFSVTAQLCNSSTIVSMHSHPPLRCVFSEQDMRAYEQFQKINPEGITALMCDKNRLTFYKQN
jgi:proteasome lid subunit RPN8/RPN11